MTSERSLENEGFIQLIEPLNHHLASRYANTNIIAGVPDNDADTTRYPLWIRPPPRRAAKQGGYPTFLLVSHPTPPAHESHKALIHVKTWWSYPDNVIRCIFIMGVFGVPTLSVEYVHERETAFRVSKSRKRELLCVGNDVVSRSPPAELDDWVGFAAIDENNNTIVRLSRYHWPGHRVDNNW
ncbi:hypothetical protein BU17DRAFT_65310 [Hysterangium stoloniferum]|nr:hypothetical protein BU17DRAFT_65310 [Hysterangium stoloniferum]